MPNSCGRDAGGARQVGRIPYRWWRTRPFAVAFLCIALSAPLSGTRAQRLRSGPEELTEEEIEASYLLNFVRFTEWAPGAVNSSLPLTICVAGRSAFSEAMMNNLAQKTVGSLSLKVVLTGEPRGISRCHVLFVDSAED